MNSSNKIQDCSWIVHLDCSLFSQFFMLKTFDSVSVSCPLWPIIMSSCSWTNLWNDVPTFSSECATCYILTHFDFITACFILLFTRKQVEVTIFVSSYNIQVIIKDFDCWLIFSIILRQGLREVISSVVSTMKGSLSLSFGDDEVIMPRAFWT